MCMCMYLNKSDLKTVCLRIAYSYRLTDFITRKKIKRNASTWNQRFIEMRQHTVCDVECVGHVRRSFVLFVRQADVCICHVSTRWRKSIFIEFCNRKTLQNCYLMTHCMWWLIQSRFEAVLTSMAIRLSVFWVLWLTCLEKTAMSSLNDSEEQTSPPATPGSRGVHVASSHFSNISARSGNSGCLKKKITLAYNIKNKQIIYSNFF